LENPKTSDLEHIIKNPDNFPTLPNVFYLLNKAIKDPDSTINDIGKIVSSDLALTTQILKLVNSSFFGFEDKVETLSHAINILGIEKLSNLVLATTVISRFEGIPEEFVTMKSFWSHSIACGLAAREISNFGMSDIKETLYVGGMIHDIGALIIYKEIPELAKEALDRCNYWGQNLVDAEKSLMGFDHTEIGSALIDHWGLPEIYGVMISYHHAPWEAPKYSKETSAIYLADYIIHCNQLGSSGELQNSPLEKKALEILNISHSAIPEISEKTIALFEETAQTFSID
jgi:HD-like signal output (HDOD) protein